jgi:hypothetical protein
MYLTIASEGSPFGIGIREQGAYSTYFSISKDKYVSRVAKSFFVG